MKWLATGCILFVSGLALVIISALLLKDGILLQNTEWEIQNDTYLTLEYNMSLEQLELDEDIIQMLIVIASVSLVAGTVQLGLPFLFYFLNHNDLKSNIRLWICTNIILALVSFALALVFSMGSMGLKGPDYAGSVSALYDYWIYHYDTGIVYNVIIFCDVGVLLVSTLLMGWWSFSLPYQGYLC